MTSRMRMRRARWWIVSTRLWWKQGKPRDMPVVIRPGRLVADPMGRGLIDGWHFDCTRQRVVITADDAWDRLSAHYPVERTDEYL